MRSWIIAGALAAVLGAGLATPPTAEAARRHGRQGYDRSHSRGYSHGGNRSYSRGYSHRGNRSYSRGYSHSYRPYYRSYYRPSYRPYYYAPYYESCYEPAPYDYGGYCRRPSVGFSFGW